MATKETVKKIFGMVFFKCPSRRFKDDEEASLITSIWEQSYLSVPDDVLLAAGAKWFTETEKLYPGDDPFATIFQSTQPKAIETPGDVVQLIDEGVSKFGMYRDDEAMAYFWKTSPLCAAAISRLGFKNYCTSENPDVCRGQLRAIFKEEKERANELGAVLKDPASLVRGSLPPFSEHGKYDRIAGSASERISLPEKKLEPKKEIPLILTEEQRQANKEKVSELLDSVQMRRIPRMAAEAPWSKGTE